MSVNNMIINPIVIDDFLPATLRDDFESYMTSGEFSWFYSPNICGKGSAPEEAFSNKKVTHSNGFYHTLFNVDFGGVTSTYFMKFNPITYFFDNLDSGFFVKDLLRLRCRMTHPQPHLNHTKDNYNVPHLDFGGEEVENHIAFIYYVNDSDGDSVIYDVTAKDAEKNPDILLDPPELIRCSPKKNRLLIFDGELYHSGNCPTNSRERITINCDFVAGNFV